MGLVEGMVELSSDIGRDGRKGAGCCADARPNAPGNITIMIPLNDPLLKYEFGGTVFFLPSASDSSAICQLEFATWGPHLVARMSLRDLDNYEIKDELLLCPDGEQRFRSRREIAPYGADAQVQLLLLRDRLTHVMVDGQPHLRVVGGWIERTEDKNGKVRTASWGIEGLLKQSGMLSAKLDSQDITALGTLHRNWRQVSE